MVWLINCYLLNVLLSYIVESSLSVLPGHLPVYCTVYPFVYLLPYLYSDVMLVWLTAEPIWRTDNKSPTYFTQSRFVELFVHCHGPSAEATPPERDGKPVTIYRSMYFMCEIVIDIRLYYCCLYLKIMTIIKYFNMQCCHWCCTA